MAKYICSTGAFTTGSSWKWVGFSVNIYSGAALTGWNGFALVTDLLIACPEIITTEQWRT